MTGGWRWAHGLSLSGFRPHPLITAISLSVKVAGGRKKLRNSSDPSFPLLPRQPPALPDRQHAAGRHCDHRRRPAAAVPRRPLRPLVLQLPRRPGLRRRPPDVLDPRGPGSEWVVSALLSPRAADFGYCVFVYKGTNYLLMRLIISSKLKIEK